MLYRALCALMFNYVPTSGHPGGSVSSGRIVAGLLLDAMDYDLSDPDRQDADLVSYAAGHKAMGLYAMWALRDEVARVGDPALLPASDKQRLRLEDLLGFRRNPITQTPLFRRFGARALDGHPTPATPFVRLSTGASGVGVASSIGLALGARDYYGADAPRVHVIEGEGGLTPGPRGRSPRRGRYRVPRQPGHAHRLQPGVDRQRARVPRRRWAGRLRAVGSAGALLPARLERHRRPRRPRPRSRSSRRSATRLRFRQGSRRRSSTTPRRAGATAWRERRRTAPATSSAPTASIEALAELTGDDPDLPTCEPGDQRCQGQGGDEIREECFWAALQIVRSYVEQHTAEAEALAARLRAACERLDGRARKPREGAPSVAAAYETAAREAGHTPDELRLASGSSTTLRQQLARSLHYLNRASNGAFLIASADLAGSTSVTTIAQGFPAGFWNAASNPGARLLSTGGICEDGMSGILSGLTAFGHHLGVGSSYGAFMAPLGQIAARLHAIGAQARESVSGDPYKPMVLVCGHTGLKTGEDGPTHADPQSLQILQESFPKGTAISLTPWDPQEIWTLTATALAKRPAVLSAFVTRPSEPVLDREALGLAPPEAAASGLYVLRQPQGEPDVVVVLQESAVAYAFVQETLPLLAREGIDALVYYVASAELFDLLPEEEQHRLYGDEQARRAIGITGFTLPTMHRWVRSEEGLAATLHPFGKGHFLGSGQGEVVLREAGLDGAGQYEAIKGYVAARARASRG